MFIKTLKAPGYQFTKILTLICCRCSMLNERSYGNDFTEISLPFIPFISFLLCISATCICQLIITIKVPSGTVVVTHLFVKKY